MTGGLAATLPATWIKPVIDSVTLPAHAQTSQLTIVDIALGAAPEFTTLVSALQAAGLVATLQGPGPFTVFAPTNAAFNNQGIPPLPADPPLGGILLYHVLPGIQPASAIPASTTSPTVVDTINASNGVIHVIDEVLLEP